MKINCLRIQNSSRIAFLCLSFMCALGGLLAQTLIFVDDFNRADITRGGVPEVTYTIASTANITALLFDGGTRLELPNKTSLQGDAFVVGSLSGYSTPFTAKLSDCSSDSFVWTFNALQNCNNRLMGFSRSSNQKTLYSPSKQLIF